MDPIKVLHCADLHFDDEQDRLQNTIECCNRVVETALIELPALIAIAGDVFERGLVLGSPGTLAAIDFVHRCGNIAPVVVTSGTPTHDAANSTEVFNRLRTEHPVHATGLPCQVGLTKERPRRFNAVNGNIEDKPELSLVVSCLPSVTRAGLMAMGSLSVDAAGIECAESAEGPVPGLGRCEREGQPPWYTDHTGWPRDGERLTPIDRPAGYRSGRRIRDSRFEAHEVSPRLPRTYPHAAAAPGQHVLLRVHHPSRPWGDGRKRLFPPHNS